jgi:hypothetical protein
VDSPGADSLGAARCATCRNDLEAQWKFCVHCGTPVPAGPATVEVPDTEPEAVPSAIRPESAVAASRRRIDARLVFGMAMAAAGLLVVLYAITSLLAARG